MPNSAHKDSASCRICGDLSFGNHYGCQSCLGCKTFFRRAVMHKQDIICKKPGLCELETSSRRLCRSCRFRRCLEMGMHPDALQPQRDPIGRRRKKSRLLSVSSHRQRNIPSPGFSSKSTKIHSSEKQQYLDKMIERLTNVDKSIRKRKFESIKARTEAKKLAETLPNMLMIQALVEWAQTLPGFTSLPLTDRLLLLKRFAMNHLVIEYGHYTAQFGPQDVWLISNGTCMPRTINILPEASKLLIPEDRKWRQEKLYKEMTDRCIDEVVAPLRRLQLTPEELVTLKIIMLYYCGNHAHQNNSAPTNERLSDECRRTISFWRNRVISSLFKFYEATGLTNYQERFGNIILLISGIVGASSAMLESYQIMRLFKIVPFDRVSEQLLFDVE